MNITQEIICLSIAGLDPTGEAGTKRDLETFITLCVPANAINTSITDQTNTEFLSMEVRNPIEFENELNNFLERNKDKQIYLKLGALGNEKIVEKIFNLIDNNSFERVILDPVFKSTSGGELLNLKGIKALKNRLSSKLDLITPNIIEAGILLEKEVKDIQQAKIAATEIKEKFKVRNVLITGGHFQDSSNDILLIDNKIVVLESKRKELKRPRGTGCYLSSAITANLSKGFGLEEAVREAKKLIK